MKQKTNGFTLVELLVVIAIIAVITGISLPALSDVMSRRQLVGVAQAVQMACMSTRARAIAQREEQYLVFYYNGDNTNRDASIPNPIPNEEGNKTSCPSGKNYTIVSYDSNSNDASKPSNVILQVGNPIEIPDVISYPLSREENEYPNRPTTINNNNNFLYLKFYSDGTLSFHGGVANQSNSPDTSNRTDLVFSQIDFMMKCYIDINQNTGKVRSRIREPRQ